MTLAFRLLLVAGALWALWIMIRNIRRSRLQISDSIFWTLFAFLLVLLAVFPEIAFFFSELLGIYSTVNLVYLVIIALLIFRLFRVTLQVSELDAKLKELTQKSALDDHEKAER
ncbi:MAG: DUF2304 domain-containing protein [Solobacterium sp.]|nr:DUF2304 domain-containing protein [Solobacterium sp.]